MHDSDLVMHLVLSHHGRFRGPGSVRARPNTTSTRHQDPNALLGTVVSTVSMIATALTPWRWSRRSAY